MKYHYINIIKSTSQKENKENKMYFIKTIY